VEEEKPESELKPIDERIEELKKEGKTKPEMVLVLYQEGYNTGEIMRRKLPLNVLQRKKEREETGVLGAIEGSVKGAGYLDELKGMIRTQIGRTRELTEEFYNLGLGVLFASLSKSGVSMEEFRKIASQEGPLREAFKRAGETVFKALEYYQSDRARAVEKERDEARAYASMIETKVEELARNVDPKLRFERMIQTYLFSGKVDPEILVTMIDKWLAMETTELRMEAIIA